MWKLNMKEALENKHNNKFKILIIQQAKDNSLWVFAVPYYLIILNMHG